MTKDEKFLPPSVLESARGQVWAQMEKDGKPFEPSAAYDLFIRYCELENPRSIRKLKETGGIKVGIRTLETYSAKFSWQARVFAYDRYIKTLEQNAKDVARFNQQRKWTERREKVRENEWNDAAQLRAKAKDFLEMPLIEDKLIEEETAEDGKTIVKYITRLPVKGSLTDVVRMIELADKLERNAVDAETDRIVITTPESQRQSDVLKARNAFSRSAELFPNKSEQERAEAIARAFAVTISEILAPDEILPTLVQDNASKMVN